MTKTEAQSKYDELQRQKEDLQNQIAPIQNKIFALSQEQEKIYLKYKLFNPMGDLKKYSGKILSSIRIFYSHENEKEICEKILQGEYLQVKTNGRLDFSDYEQGILRYDEEEQTYKWWYHRYSSVYKVYGWDSLILE